MPGLPCRAVAAAEQPAVDVRDVRRVSARERCQKEHRDREVIFFSRRTELTARRRRRWSGGKVRRLAAAFAFSRVRCRQTNSDLQDKILS
jgi:hypothetical protein